MKKITICLALLLLFVAQGFAQVQIGNGNQAQKRVPFEPYFGYSYGQSIYYASEINAEGAITSIQWYYNGSGASGLSNSQELTIYMAHSSKVAFASDTDWEPYENLVEVYSGGIEVEGPGWVTIELTDPFQYNGEDNLIVAVSELQEGYDTVEDTFRAFEVSENRSLAYVYDYEVPNIETPPTASVIDQYVPNIILGGLVQECPTPVQVSVTNVSSNSAIISWAEPSVIPSGGSAYYISESAANPDATTTPTGTIASGNTVTVSSGLEAATQYFVWVKNLCGSNWSYATSFVTECEAVSTFFENFDTTAPLTLTDCWSSIFRNGATNNASITVISNAETSLPNNIRIQNGNSSLESDIILVSPKLTTLEAGTHRLKFMAKGYSPSNLIIGTLDSTTNEAVFSPVDEAEITTEYQEYIIDFTSYTGTDSYIGIRLDALDEVSIFLDDIRWEVAPLCDDVVDISIPFVSPETAEVTWNPMGSETKWEVAYGAPTLTEPSTLEPIEVLNTPYATISGLSPSTAYRLWVRSVCGENDGAWIGPINFSTSCLPIGVFNENFDDTETYSLPNCWTKILKGPTLANGVDIEVVGYEAYSGENAVSFASYDSDTAGEDYIILVSPNLSSMGLGTHRVKFFAKGPAIVEIGSLSSNTNEGQFSSLEALEITETYAEYAVDFTNYEGTDTYIGFRLASTEQYTQLYLDNIRWEVAPLCADVSEITLQSITTNSALISWLNNGNENNWQIVYGSETDTDPSLLQPQPAINLQQAEINDLQPATTYNAWVRSVCGDPNGNGLWIGPITFTTECVPTANFNENFEEQDAINSLPLCWTAIKRGEGLGMFAAINVVEFNAYEGTQSLMLDNSSSDALSSDLILVSPKLNSLGAGTHQLTFYVDAYSPTTFQVGTLDSNSEDAVFNLWEEYTTTDEYQQITIDLTDYQGTDTFIGIRHADAEENKPIFIDNMIWQSTLGNNPVEVNDLRYYPNPVKEVLNLSYSENISTVAVFNLLGQMVADYTVNSTSTQVNMSAFSSGAYVVKITVGNQTKTIKIIKE
ncbi:hypothetical protein J2X31_001487 [Flavobacterium arsenatis]|uniref:Fibronectin type-III domain-containing protein n=1 Tax=Flavobacterium arsenatis TaxID=1484332 RepID=A0ABU1TNE7_9FLAO|nr:choice-of-anchor J domain-containing protein [Flavobacterium arsenatis]MDR6967476.1 hypothetical protein [Flavobacterium arsenatis]